MRYLIYNKIYKLFQVMETKADEKNPFLICQVLVIAKPNIDGEMIELLKRS